LEIVIPLQRDAFKRGEQPMSLANVCESPGSLTHCASEKEVWGEESTMVTFVGYVYIYVFAAALLLLPGSGHAQTADEWVQLKMQLQTIQQGLRQLQADEGEGAVRRLGLVVGPDSEGASEVGWNSVFGPLSEMQMVADDRDPVIATKYRVDDAFVAMLRQHYEDNNAQNSVEGREKLLYFLSGALSAEAQTQQCALLYSTANLDDCAFQFASALEGTGAFGDSSLANVDEAQYIIDGSWSKTTTAYVRVAEFMFHSPDAQEQQRNLFKLAGRFVKFCFADGPRFAVYQKVLENKQFHPLVRFMHSVMWYQLSGSGWRVWSLAVLDNVVADAKRGKEIVYLAGGVDVNQLVIAMVQRGVREFRIRVVDPMRPTQAKYYGGDSANFRFLVEHPGAGDGVGDRIRMTLQVPDAGKKSVVLRRSSVRYTGEFIVSESAGLVPCQVTQWAVYDLSLSDSVPVGVVEFDRRRITQADLAVDKSETSLLIGFNELAYMTRAGQWGLDMDQLPDGFEMRVKQLAYTVDRTMVQNIRSANQMDEFSFIRFGSDTE
jgi:hypothetical protein